MEDNGVGFDQAHASKLSDVFERLHALHELERTGIGLALARRIVTRHGGEVRAEGDPGSGARLFFSLPEIAPGS